MYPDNVLKAFEKKQDDMQKLLIVDQDRQRRMLEDLQAVVKGHHEPKEQPEAKKPKDKKILFPDSALFKGWGKSLSEEDQREAETLFKKYGYNVFLSDRLPLDRTLPDTREPRYEPPCSCAFYGLQNTLIWSLSVVMCMNRCSEKRYPKDLPSLSVVLIYLDEALSVIKRALRSIVNRTPKDILKEIVMVDDNSSNGWFIGHNASASARR